MSNHKIIDVGGMGTWGEAGKRFIEKEIGAQFMGTSINSTEPGGESPFWHRHSALEEMYIFLEGQGEMALGDDVVAVGPGSVALAAPNVWHALRCLPDSAVPLKWICVRAGGDTLEAVGNDAELDKERPFPWTV